MKVAIIKYNAGNIFSVNNALLRLGVEAEITDDVAKLQTADKVIFPGVGEASTTMAYLRARGLDEVICNLRQPVLGICIGLQLMCRHSEEADTACLGIFGETVKRFVSADGSQKIPHMGWNSLRFGDSPLFAGIEQGAYVYYVHSYCATVGAETIAETDYIEPFSAALHRDNFYAVQFHPEKSGEVGAQVLKNFIELL